MKTAEEILAFWFGADDDVAATAAEQQHLWWSGAADVDEDLRARGADALHDDAIAGRLRPWLATPRGRLAAIIVVDQFSRSLFRGTPDAYAHDPVARGWCVEGLMLQQDRELGPLEKMFFYLPLEHSESEDDQKRSVVLNEQVAAEVPKPHRELFEYFAKFAHGHRDEIRRFGRFPGRNAVLGRVSTPEERDFLRSSSGTSV